MGSFPLVHFTVGYFDLQQSKARYFDPKKSSDAKGLAPQFYNQFQKDACDIYRLSADNALEVHIRRYHQDDSDLLSRGNPTLKTIEMTLDLFRRFRDKVIVIPEANNDLSQPQGVP